MDVNVSIATHGLHHGLDFWLALRVWLEVASESGRIFGVEKEGGEALGLGDQLSDWARARDGGFFLRPNISLVRTMSVVTTRARAQGYNDKAVNALLQVADDYLLARVHSTGHTVVTHEVPSESIRKIKIPDAWIGLGIRCMTPIRVLRRERARFVLGAAR